MVIPLKEPRCANKLTFRSREAAENYFKRWKAHTPRNRGRRIIKVENQRAYKCSECGEWHLTRQR